MENITVAVKNKMAVKYGLILGAIYVVLFTCTSLLINNFISFIVMRSVAYILYFVLIGVFLTQIKKANGGFIEFREVFGASFIIVLIAGFVYYIYCSIYFLYINPHFMEYMKSSVITFMENMHTPSQTIDAKAADLDKAVAESKIFNFWKSIQGYLSSVVLDSIFAMIVCAIVKKSRPVFG